MLEAENAIHHKKPELAFKILENFTEEFTLSSDDQTRISNLKAEAHYLKKIFFLMQKS